MNIKISRFVTVGRLIVPHTRQSFWLLFVLLWSLFAVPYYPFYLRAEIIRDIAFPMQGSFSFTDNYGDPRSGGRTHEGVDIIAPKMTSAVAAVDGIITHVVNPEESWGYALYLRDADGYEYRYLHLNNDMPGTDDGNGGPEHAYAPGIDEGTRVTRGQHIAWVGDSGNAERVGSHLHFEIWDPSDNPINPYQSLLASVERGAFDPVHATALATSISVDKGLTLASGETPCTAHSLVKSSLTTAVYYCGIDGKRYVFPNQKIYFSWYKDFSNVITLTSDELAAIPIGGNATYRPGVRMVKLETDPKVYAVSTGGVLRWVVSTEAVQALYGTTWAKYVDDLSDAFFVNYSVGDPINSV